MKKMYTTLMLLLGIAVTMQHARPAASFFSLMNYLVRPCIATTIDSFVVRETCLYVPSLSRLHFYTGQTMAFVSGTKAGNIVITGLKEDKRPCFFCKEPKSITDLLVLRCCEKLQCVDCFKYWYTVLAGGPENNLNEAYAAGDVISPCCQWPLKPRAIEAQYWYIKAQKTD